MKKTATSEDHAQDAADPAGNAGVSFLAEPGEFVAVVGPSGCGHSSLLNAIAVTLAPAYHLLM